MSAAAAVTHRHKPEHFAYLLLLPALLIIVPFFLLPLAVLVRNSLSRDDPQLILVDDVTLGNYVRILTDWYYSSLFINSLATAAAVALITLVIGYPFAYYLVRWAGRRTSLLMWIVYTPIIISVITRVFGWMVITADTGLINALLMRLGVIDGPLHILFGFAGMLIGMVHRYLPLMILPLVNAISRIDTRVMTASESLGASGHDTFWRITLPLSLPGIVVGIQLTVAVVLSDYVLPTLLGTTRFRMIAPAIYDEAISMVRWASAATMAIVTIAVVALVLIGMNLLMRRLAPWTRIL
ncbi:MAG: ABC transporter permease [Parvibaculaceae bacterium]